MSELFKNNRSSEAEALTSRSGAGLFARNPNRQGFQEDITLLDVNELLEKTAAAIKALAFEQGNNSPTNT